MWMTLQGVDILLKAVYMHLVDRYVDRVEGTLWTVAHMLRTYDGDLQLLSRYKEEDNLLKEARRSCISLLEVVDTLLQVAHIHF